nr:Ger(x)C family spore germination protein [Anaeromonas frigoriresistens]
MIISVLMLNGCWDYKEVEKRGYVLGIGIDEPFPIPQGDGENKSHMSEKELELYELQQGDPRYAFTIQVPILPKAQIKPLGAGGGGGEESRSWNLTLLGRSFFEANREFSTRVDYMPFYEHLQVIVLNENIAKNGIIPPLDMILRDPEMRRRTRVFVAPDKALDVLKVSPKIDDYASLYLQQLPNNADKTSRMAHVTDLGEVAESLHSNTDFVLPRVISTEDEIKNAGLAVFKKDKMVGWLGEVYTIYTKWIRDAVKGGIIVIKSPEDPSVLITLELSEVKTKVKPIIDGDNIKMKIESKAVVNIAEITQTKHENVLDEAFIERVEKEAEKEVSNRIQEAIKYVQKKLGADIFHFNVIMKSFAPNEWEKVKDDWHSIFETLEAEVNVDIKVDHVGIIK